MLISMTYRGTTLTAISNLGYGAAKPFPDRVCRIIQSYSLSHASDDFGNPNFGELFRAQIPESWGHDVCGMVLGYVQNSLLDSTEMKHQNGLLCCRPPFHSITSVDHRELDCKVEYTNANQGMMPESHNIWVQYTDSDLHNTFQGRVPAFPVI